MAYINIDTERFGHHYHPIEQRTYIFDKKNNRMVKSFGQEARFIHQYKRNNKILFAVGICDTDCYYLTAFDIYGNEESIYSDKRFTLETPIFENVYLGNDCFLLDNDQIISLKNENICGPYDTIMNGEETEKNLGPNNILVSRVIEDFEADIIETIIFGLDLNNFKVTTPIYSKMQDRYIKRYSKKEVIDAEEKYPEWTSLQLKGNVVPDLLANETVRYEILRPFKIIGEQLKSTNVYDKDGFFDSGFVKKFKDNK